MARKLKNIGVEPDTHRLARQIAREKRWSLKTVVDEGVKLLKRNNTASPESIP